jgi:hypothetical protein
MGYLATGYAQVGGFIAHDTQRSFVAGGHLQTALINNSPQVRFSRQSAKENTALDVWA